MDLADQVGSLSFPPGFGLCYTPQALKGAVDYETASGLLVLDQNLDKSCKSLKHNVNYENENILIEASKAFRIKAPSRMVISNPKKMCTNNFKRRGPKSKPGKGKAGHSVKETQVEDIVEENDEAKAKKAWEIGKQLGLSIKGEDVVIKEITDVFLS